VGTDGEGVQAGGHLGDRPGDGAYDAQGGRDGQDAGSAQEGDQRPAQLLDVPQNAVGLEADEQRGYDLGLAGTGVRAGALAAGKPAPWRRHGRRQGG
jgi:hypothetical protein